MNKPKDFFFPQRPQPRKRSKIRVSSKLRSIQLIIMLTFTAVTVAVAVIVSIMLYGKFARTAEENANLNMQQIIEQVNYNLELYVKGMSSIFETAEQQITTSESIDSPLLYERMDTLMSSREDLVSMAMFTPQGQYVVGTPGQRMRLNTQLESQSWFTTAKRTSEISYSAPHIQNLFKGKYTWVVSISKMIQYMEHGELKTGILLLDFNFRTIDELSKQVKLGKRGYAYILDPLGNIVYHPQQQLIYAGLKYENVEPVLEYAFRSYLDESTGEKRFITVRTLAQTGWKIVGVAYYDEIVTTKRDLNQFLAWFLAVVLVCVIAVSVLLSWLIASPIRKLERTVKQVGEGDLNTPINVSGAYEVEQLSKRFNMMLQRIRQLMDQIIYEQETKRKGELEVLQSQINPHFLYNTLNSVIRLAERGKTDEVVTMIQSLSKFFRISLSKGKNFITMQEELDHIRHYLVIQSFRFKNKFRYEINAQEEVLQYQTIKLILQPIVENALYHGIEMLPDEGLISISAVLQEGLVVIRISDNGLGMSKETMNVLLSGGVKSEGGSGVGVRNVNERIGLYYGREYGLTFESELEEGTTVTIIFPARLTEEAPEAKKEETDL
ncbi:sensor histidine kinase [Paenibacillus sp. MMS20-IR301]|uniref:sensor histidine kinase n=1 Tax=Paenibacillus sp. MMS20-IR301 TaxID=2895946 RepID=UPI0028EC368E|nr:sensor histidine kinase [Paenibacillus sp. MMS20-IR301]WNS44563.1 sensor histidine kinase [Paenibacillus sp. MMS20-IR301]